MNYILETVELESDIKDWLNWFCYDNQMPYREALNLVLSRGKQVSEHNKIPLELPTAQKLVMQCVMESLLILKEAYLPNLEQRQALSEKAKSVIRKTLELPEAVCPSS